MASGVTHMYVCIDGNVYRRIGNYDFDTRSTLTKMLHAIGCLPNGSTIVWGEELFIPGSTGYWGFELTKLYDSLVSLYAICGRTYRPVTINDIKRFFRKG